MKWTQKTKFTVLMTFHLMWGFVLWFSISKYGLGISSDSTHLLFAALNFSQGRGLFSFDGNFVSSWPPLYPMLLALIQLVTRLNPFYSALALQVTAFAGISVCLSILFLKIFPDNFGLALAASVLSEVGILIPNAFGFVDSDYLHLFLVMLFVVLAGYAIERKSGRLLVGLSVVGMLAMLQRYLGIAAIGTGLVIVFFSTTGSLKQRILRSALMALSALPAGIWLYFASTAYRGPVSFGENFYWFSRSILDWFIQTQTIRSQLNIYIAALWMFIGGLIALLLFSRRDKAFPPFEVSLFVYGIFYVLALFGSASVAYFNRLTGRFLLPIYIPLMTLFVAAFQILLRRSSQSSVRLLRQAVPPVFFVLLALGAWGLLRVTIPAVLDSHSNGLGGFNSRAWHENSVMNYWLAHPPQGDYLLFSNYPDGVAFHTWHACSNSPAEYPGPYGKVQIPLTDYSQELFSSGREVYLVWIEPNAYSYYYKPGDFSLIAEVKPLFADPKDGGVYLLTPKGNSAP